MRKTAPTYGEEHNRRIRTGTSQEFASVYEPKKIVYGYVLLPNHKRHCRTLPVYCYSEEAFSHVRKRSFLQRNKLHGKFPPLGKFVSLFVLANLPLRHIVFLPTGKLTSTLFMCITSWLVGRQRRLFCVRSCSWVLLTIRYISSSKCSCYRAEWLGRRSRGFFIDSLEISIECSQQWKPDNNHFITWLMIPWINVNLAFRRRFTAIWRMCWPVSVSPPWSKPWWRPGRPHG